MLALYFLLQFAAFAQPAPEVAAIQSLLADQKFLAARDQAKALLNTAAPDSETAAVAMELLARGEIGSGNVTDSVRELIQRAEALHRKLGGETSPGFARALWLQGWYSAARTRYADAIALYRKAIAIQEQANAPLLERADTLHALTRALHSTDKFDEAIATGRRVLALREQAAGPDSALAGNGHYALGFALERVKEDEAQGEYTIALTLLEKHRGPDHPDVGDTCEALGRLTYARKRYADAQKWYERTIAIVEKNFPAKHPRFISLLNNYALSRKIQGDYAGGRDAFERALSISLAVYGEDNSRTAQVLANLGIVLQDMGDYSGALRSYERGLRIQTRLLGDQHILVARIYRSMQRLQQVLGDFPNAERNCQRARAIFEKTLGAENEANIETTQNCALLLDAMGRHREALPLAQQALRSAEKIHGPDSWGAAQANHILGEVQLGLRELPASRAHLERGIALAERNNDKRTATIATRQLAELATLDHKPQEAVRYAHTATTEAEAYFGPRSPEVVSFLRVEARALDAAAQRVEAFDKAVASEALRQETLRTTAAGIPERLAMSYRGEEDSSLNLVLTWMRSPAEQKRAWELLARGRNIVLDETTARSREWRRQSDPQTAAAWTRLKEARAQLAAAALRASESGVKSATRDIDSARREKERLESELAASNSALRSSFDRERASLDDALHHLPANSVLVAYCAAGRYRAFIGNSRGLVAAVTLPPAATIDALVRDWRNEIRRERDSFGRNRAANERTYTAAALALRRAIWDPIRPSVGQAQRVFIVPDGRLHEINFAALPSDAGGYLIERAPMLHILNSELDLATPAPPSVSSPRRLLALGAPAFDGVANTGPLLSRAFRGGESSCATFRDLKFAPLPASGSEVADVAGFAKARGWIVDALQNTAATETALKQAVRGQDVVHLATHGFFLDRDCGGRQLAESPLLRAGLALAGANRRALSKPGEEDGILTAEEAASLDLDGTAWIVLSGCDTGAGEIHSGEGVLGLRRALQEAGARTQITSLWPVRDDDARLWMRTLYEGRLQQRLSTIEAWTRASRTELARRRAAGLSTHPFHWATFVAAGDWR